MSVRRWLSHVTVFLCASKIFAQEIKLPFTPNSNESSDPSVQKIGNGGIGGGSMKKFGQAQAQQGPYGMVDVRHTTNDYFDQFGNRIRREPALHGSLRIGSKFYGDTLDISAGVGGSKLPASQRVFQSRPDLLIDMYPLKSRTGNLMLYANATFPVRESDLDPTEFADGDTYDRDYRRSMDATVLTFGFAPNIKTEIGFRLGRIGMLVGADAWTRLYSKPLYIEEGDGSRELGLIQTNSDAISTSFEDRALRYTHQEMAGVSVSPWFMPKLSAEISGYSESRYLPRYYRNSETDGWDYVYQPERISFTRIKMVYDLSVATTISNEVYYFRNGFFAADRINDQRRYRNIVRLSTKL